MKAVLLTTLVIAAAGIGCGSEQSGISAPATSPVTTIAIRGMQFSPAALEIKVGDVVAWKNEDVVPHTATTSIFDSGALNPGQTWQHTFTNAGKFNYICTFHPAMKGTVNVK